MQRDEGVTFAAARSSQAALAPRAAHVSAAGLARGKASMQAVDHDVADEVDARGRDALAREISDRVLLGDEEQIRDLIDDDAVDFLRHRAVEAAQSRFDMNDGNSFLLATRAAASVELTSPTTTTASGFISSSTARAPASACLSVPRDSPSRCRGRHRAAGNARSSKSTSCIAGS